MKTSKKTAAKMILWALVWAFAFMASAIIFQGKPAKEWIQAALFIVGMSFWLSPLLYRARPRC